jgi:hypothetical protein
MSTRVNGNTGTYTASSFFQSANGNVTNAGGTGNMIWQGDSSTTMAIEVSYNCISSKCRIFGRALSNNGGGTHQHAMTAIALTDSIANITQIEIVGANANSIGVGSTFRLYKRK